MVRVSELSRTIAPILILLFVRLISLGISLNFSKNYFFICKVEVTTLAWRVIAEIWCLYQSLSSQEINTNLDQARELFFFPHGKADKSIIRFGKEKGEDDIAQMSGRWHHLWADVHKSILATKIVRTVIFGSTVIMQGNMSRSCFIPFDGAPCFCF